MVFYPTSSDFKHLYCWSQNVNTRISAVYMVSLCNKNKQPMKYLKKNKTEVLMTYLPPSLLPPSPHHPHFASGQSDHCTVTPGMSSPAPQPARHQAPPQLPLLVFPQRPLGLPHRALQLHTRLQHLHRAPAPVHTLPPASEGRRTWAKQPGKKFSSDKEGGGQVAAAALLLVVLQCGSPAGGLRQQLHTPPLSRPCQPEPLRSWFMLLWDESSQPVSRHSNLLVGDLHLCGGETHVIHQHRVV